MLAAKTINDLTDFPFPDDTLVGAKDYEDFLSTPQMKALHQQKRSVDIVAMNDVVKRIRAQLRYILRSVRAWRASHDDYENAIRLRYSAYEGALCYTDLRRHWAYYRHAMRELSALRQLKH
ncbi:MAG: hypothetical protein AB8B83_04345 [Bdellovibrionales bacterium]